VISVAIKLLGISGTPVKGGNCNTMVQEALKSAAQVPESKSRCRAPGCS
jgi:hypothetical protein